MFICLAADECCRNLDSRERTTREEDQGLVAAHLQHADKYLAADVIGGLKTGGGELSESAQHGAAGEGIRVHRGSESHGEVVGEGLRQLGEETVAREGEDAAPETIHVHGDDGGLRAAGNHFHTAANGSEAAAAGQLAFGENADDVAVFDGACSFDDGFARVAGRNGQGVEDFQSPAQQAHGHELLCHNEAHRSGAHHGEEERIGVGHMVHHQQGAATHGQAVQIDGARAVDQLQAPDANHADELLGNQTQRADEDEEAQQEKDEELHLRRGAEDFVHDPHDNHGHQAHEVVDEVAGGDDVAAVVGVAVVLKESVERHQVGSAEGTRERQQGVAGVGVDLKDGEQEGAGGDTDGAEGNEPEFILALAELGGHHATQHHAAGHPCHEDTALQREVHSGVGGLHALGYLDENEEQGACQTPEIGNAQLTESQQTVLPQVLDLPEMLVEQTPAERLGFLGGVARHQERGCAAQAGKADENPGGQNHGIPAGQLLGIVGRGVLRLIGRQEVREPEEHANLRHQQHKDQAHFNDA